MYHLHTPHMGDWSHRLALGTDSPHPDPRDTARKRSKGCYGEVAPMQNLRPGGHKQPPEVTSAPWSSGYTHRTHRPYHPQLTEAT